MKQQSQHKANILNLLLKGHEISSVNTGDAIRCADVRKYLCILRKELAQIGITIEQKQCVSRLGGKYKKHYLTLENIHKYLNK